MKKVKKSLLIVFALIMVLATVFAFVGCKDNVEKNEAKSIAIVIDGEKITLEEGTATVDAIKSAITVEATLNDGTKVVVTDYEITGFDPNAEGEQTVTVTYKTLTATIKVEVAKSQEEPTPEKIEIQKAGDKLELTENNATVEAIRSAITVKVVYSDDSEKTVSDYEISGFKADAEGEQNVTIKHSGLTATLVVIVNHPAQPVLTGITVVSIGDDISLEQGYASVDALKALITVTAEYSDGSSNVVTNYEVIGLDVDAIGTQTVTVKYDETTATVDVTIIELIVSLDYKVVIHGSVVVRLTPSDCDDPYVTEQFSATFDLTSGDTIKITDVDGNEYANFEPDCKFNGEATVSGSYTLYLKFYQDGGNSIWVTVPQGEDPDPTPELVIKVIVGENEYTLIENTETDKGDGRLAEYMGKITLNVGDTIVIVDNNNHEYVNYEPNCPFQGTALATGDHDIYVKIYPDGDSIWVTAPQGEDPIPTPSSYKIVVGEREIVLETLASDNEYVIAQYSAKFNLTKGDAIKVVDNDGKEYANYETNCTFKGTALADGEHTLYLKFYQDGGDSIWVTAPQGEEPDPTPEVEIKADSVVVISVGEKKVNCELNAESLGGNVEFMALGVELKVDDVVVITVDGKEYADYKDCGFNGKVTVNGKYDFYIANDGIWVTVPQGEEPDPTPEVEIKADSVVVISVGENKVNCELNAESLGGNVEFMALGVELKVDDVVVITVDGKEYANYKDCGFNGKVTVNGKHDFYIANDGIWVTVPVVEPDPTPEVEIKADSVVVISVGENKVNCELNAESLGGNVEFMALGVELKVDDVVVITVDGKEYADYKDCGFNGKVTVNGKHDFYVANDGIWVTVPQGEEPDPTPEVEIKADSVVVISVGEKKVNCELNAESLGGNVEFMALGVELKVDDVVVITVDGKEYADYKDCGFNGKVTVNGKHDFYVANDGIWVTVPQGEEPDPTPTPDYTVSVVINGDVENAVVLKAQESAYSSMEYTGTFTLAVGDTIKVLGSDGYEYETYENADAFDGTAKVAGEYTIYVKCYDDMSNAIYTQVPSAVVVPDPDTKNITVYYYNINKYVSVYAHYWNDDGATTTWPGVAMTAVEGHDGWYSIEVSTVYTFIIFNNGSGKQTSDLTIDINKVYYNGYEWTDGYNLHEGKTTRTVYYYNKDNWTKVNAYAWTNGNEMSWPGVAMTAVEGHDGWYSIELSLNLSMVIFNNGSAQSDNIKMDTSSDTVYYNNGWVKSM